ncbi:hypothetical protein [Paraburkholderia sp. XV]|uniref:hypothetical protein n=1 Tax=Paraburkholderia sp. XV TaxID=2831520 RepID=UPI001CD1C54D|nr:hypothetical protein [Paraburkholderia sp. XV]
MISIYGEWPHRKVIDFIENTISFYGVAHMAGGQRFRALTIVDVFTREALAIDVGQRLGA